MSNIQDIEKLAQQTFSNFEADVPAEAWTNIQNALLLSPAVPSANTIGNAKTRGIFSKINAVVLWSSSVAIVSIVAGGLYFSSSEEIKKENFLQDEIITAPTTQAQSSEQQFNNQQSTSNNSPSPQPTKENATIAAADDKNISHQAFSANDDVEPVTREEAKKITEPAADNSQTAESVHQSTVSSINESKKEDAGVQEESSSDENETTPAVLSENKETISDAASLGFIPNVITPNSDNENDVFIIEGSGLKSLKVTIKDRTGKTVHEWNGLHGFWDGRLENGSDAKPGIYFYNIFAISEKGKPLTSKASFRLIR